ncbi:Ras-related small GTP-binding family protein isoform 1 [Theobroma cacao]|uniref:Ras-related small GTP-binding family protein isoform 1 n=1 Tax=Theobroma cacao TaxID=3641 RepID=A0A061FD93_THECC|nr:Ras-related small GTP-binding family protein isoform 1 [Theobroma cacao]
MSEIIHEATGKMTQLCRKIVHVNIKWSIFERVSIFRRFFRFIWDRILVCSIGRPVHYRRLTRRDSPPVEGVLIDNEALPEDPRTMCNGYETDSDLVSLKISLLGDCQIGKTSFLIKYAGDEQERCLEMAGLNLVNKTSFVQGARIAFSIWDVGGDSSSLDHLPIACKDAVAILFMFDLTSRCTLNSVVGWYTQARKWNQVLNFLSLVFLIEIHGVFLSTGSSTLTGLAKLRKGTAIPILIGTKFDDFVRLPPDLQWTIVTQARAYARAMKATLFFSSATHNINVNKIFKFIMAKLFNLPWTVERNLTIGEPIIDF